MASTSKGKVDRPQGRRPEDGRVHAPYRSAKRGGSPNNGNVEERSGPNIPGGTQTFEYTPFDLPSRVTTGTGALEKVTEFEYSADEMRLLRRDADQTRHFVTDIYQRVVDNVSDATVEERFRLIAGGRLIGEIVCENGQDETLYFHTDHLGSTDVISNDAADFSRQEFDVFGGPNPLNPELTRTGFTGHQHDDDLGLIDMRGRVYDPLAGRFMSADPVMQAPFFSQGLNRYSYVFNDPVNNVDPNGMFAQAVVGAVVGLAGAGIAVYGLMNDDPGLTGLGLAAFGIGFGLFSGFDTRGHAEHGLHRSFDCKGRREARHGCGGERGGAMGWGSGSRRARRAAGERACQDASTTGLVAAGED